MKSKFGNILIVVSLHNSILHIFPRIINHSLPSKLCSYDQNTTLFPIYAPLVTLLAARDIKGGPIEWITLLSRRKVRNESDDLPALSKAELLRARGFLAIG